MRRVSINTIAEAAGVSRNTVSLALRGDARVLPATRDRVLEAAKKLNYRPNLLARAMVTGRSSVIGLLIPRLNHLFMPQFVDAIQEAAFHHDLAVLMCAHHNDLEKLQDLLQSLEDRQVDGMIIYHPLCAAGTAVHFPAAVPLVNVAHDSAERAGLTYLLLPETAGAAQVGKLVEAQHRRLAYVGDARSDVGAARFLGAQKATATAELPPLDIFETEASIAGGRQAAKDFLASPSRATGLIASSDAVALGFIRGVTEAGLRVPQDLSIVGAFDLPICEASVPGLTTLRVPAEELGQSAVEALLATAAARTQGRREFSWLWVDRGSVAPPPDTTGKPIAPQSAVREQQF